MTDGREDARDTSPIPGGWYLLTEADYKFGQGPLLIRVVQVIGAVEFAEGSGAALWWRVQAVCSVPQHTGPGQQRSLYVRSDCLEGALRKRS